MIQIPVTPPIHFFGLQRLHETLSPGIVPGIARPTHADRDAGGFEPLRFLPKGNKIVVLGLITSKSGRLEPRADVKKRIEEATKFVALDQLCLSPQCGFASTEEGNVLAEEEQWAKLRMVVELSEEVWGK